MGIFLPLEFQLLGRIHSGLSPRIFLLCFECVWKVKAPYHTDNCHGIQDFIGRLPWRVINPVIRVQEQIFLQRLRNAEFIV